MRILSLLGVRSVNRPIVKESVTNLVRSVRAPSESERGLRVKTILPGEKWERICSSVANYVME